MLVIQQDFLTPCPTSTWTRNPINSSLTNQRTQKGLMIRQWPCTGSVKFPSPDEWLFTLYSSLYRCVLFPQKMYLVRFSRVHLLSSGSQTWRTTAQLLYRSSWSYASGIHYSRNNGCDFKWQVTPRKWSCHGMGRSSTKSSVHCVAVLSAGSGTKGLPKNKSKNEPVWMH